MKNNGQLTINECSNWELMEKWKSINPTIKVINKKVKREFPNNRISHKLYEEVWNRIQPSVKWNANYMLKHLVQKDLEFEDCIQEIAECLKNVFLWFNESSFTGDKGKLSISKYLHDQVTARVQAMNKTFCEYSYQGKKFKKFREEKITSEEQMEVIETIHSKSYVTEWDESLEIYNFAKSLSEIEQKILKLVMQEAPIKDAIKEVGVTKSKYLKLVREVSSKAVSYNKGR